MNEKEEMKKLIEQIVLDNALPSLLEAREFGDIEHNDPAWAVSPDFVQGLNGQPVGIEIAEIRNEADAWDILAEAYRLAEQKHQSYSKRGLFTAPIILLLYSYGSSVLRDQGAA